MNERWMAGKVVWCLYCRKGDRKMFGETEQAGPKRKTSFAELGRTGVASDRNKR